MEVETIKINEKLAKISRDVELIKNILMSAGELSDWAKNQLEIARKTPRSEYISHEEVKKRILSKK